MLSVITFAVLTSSCSTYLPFRTKPLSTARFFRTEYAVAWTAAVESVANVAGDVPVEQNQEQGVIRTGWIENSKEWSFFEVFKEDDIYLRSRYRLYIFVNEGRKYGEEPVVMIRIQREHQVEKTFLAGWETIETDGRVESTILYRMGRLIAMREYQDKLDEKRARKMSIDF